ncbi:hypothetical protein [Phage f2b1]|nr:hypothetical protein [Phage f2b1]
MKAICTKDVVFMGKVVFEEGQMYNFKEENTGALEGYTVNTSMGHGFFSKKDKTLKKHFKKEGDLGFKKLEKAYMESLEDTEDYEEDEY